MLSELSLFPFLQPLFTGQGSQPRAILLRPKTRGSTQMWSDRHCAERTVPGYRCCLLLTAPQAQLALVAPWEKVCPWLRLLSAGSQGCSTHWCLTPSALACIPSGLCLPETRLAELQGEPSACSSPSSGSLLTATWPSSVSTGPPQLVAICKHGTCALHRLLQATDRDVKQKMNSMAQITLTAV